MSRAWHRRVALVLLRELVWAREAEAVEPIGDGELRVRRATLAFEDAFGALTGDHPPGYLDQLDETTPVGETPVDADVPIGALDSNDVRHTRARRVLTQWRRHQDAVMISLVSVSKVLIAPAADLSLLATARE